MSFGTPGGSLPPPGLWPVAVRHNPSEQVLWLKWFSAPMENPSEESKPRAVGMRPGVALPRCHLPACTVSYPADFIFSASVVTARGRPSCSDACGARVWYMCTG